MNSTGGFTKKMLGVLGGMAAALLALLSPRLALANSNNGTLTHVEYFYNGGTPQLLLQQGGNSSVNYFGQMVNPIDQTTHNPCSPAVNVDIDTIKIWASIAQAAQLSGKNTTIYYSVCNGTNYINDVLMFN
jgi:hypothetical protein